MINLVTKMRKLTTDRGAGKKEVFHDNGATVTIRPGEWVDRGADEYESVFKRPQTDSIRTNIPVKKMYSLTSQAKDWFLELQLRSDKYKFNNMLVVTDPFGVAPLTALALFTTIMDYRVRVTVVGDSEDTGFVFEYPAEKRHRIPILGLYPGRDTEVVIELLDENGESCDCRRFLVNTKPLPEHVPEHFKIEKGSGNTRFSDTLIAGNGDLPPLVFDKEGKLRYYLEEKQGDSGIFPLSKGRFLFMEPGISVPSAGAPNSVQMYDMDYLGRVGRTYLVRDGVCAAIEKETSGDSLLVTANASGEQEGGRVLEIDRETGEIVQKIEMTSLDTDGGQDYVNVSLEGIPGQFRAYGFCPDMTSLSKALVKNTNYIVGELMRPGLIEEEEAERLEFQSAAAEDTPAEFEMQEDVLYIYDLGHAVKRIILRGKTGIWDVEWEDTYQTAGISEGIRYGIAVWLDTLPADAYDLYLYFGDELHDTGKKITKQK